MKGAIFTDAWWQKSQEEHHVAFKASFKEQLSRSPKIFDAILFDALQFAMVTHKSANHYEVQSNLGSSKISKALTGGFQFREDREIDRQLLLLELSKDGIQPWKNPKDEE